MTPAAMTGYKTAPLVVNLAPTGMIPTRGMSAHVPLTATEIIDDVLAAAEIGITMVHLHARDDNGKPTYRKEVYAPIIAGIREKRSDVIICVSCSGRDFTELDQRADVLDLPTELRPDMASLTTSSLNFPGKASVNEPQMVLSLAQRMLERGILPEIEIFDLGMTNYARYLIDKLSLKEPIYANVILNNIATAQPDLLSIAALVQGLPSSTVWGLGGIGDAQLPVTALAAAYAPAVRVGLEDGLWLDRQRTILATNPQLVQRVHNFAALLERPIMQGTALRNLLGLRNF
jgi:3-keto-5-aminohexanoate cleavage enzyme